jgi:hypothetical protein
MALNINNDAQIAYGSDGNLYAIATIDEPGGGSQAFILGSC